MSKQTKNRSNEPGHASTADNRNSVLDDKLRLLLERSVEGVHFERAETVRRVLIEEHGPKEAGRAGMREGREVPHYRAGILGSRIRYVIPAAAAAAAALVLVTTVSLTLVLGQPEKSPVAAAERGELIVLGEKPFPAVQLSAAAR